MAESGAQRRPARILLSAAGLAVERVLTVLRAEGYIVEAVPDVTAVLSRLERGPPVDVLVANGTDALERARVLAAARARNTWCVYLRSQPGSELPPVQRAQLIAAIPLEADDSQIAKTIRTVVQARRARSAG